MSVNFDKVKAVSKNKKHSYKELHDDCISSNNKKYSYEKSFGDDTSSSSKKRNYEELFGDISDFLDTDVPGVVID